VREQVVQARAALHRTLPEEIRCAGRQVHQPAPERIAHRLLEQVAVAVDVRREELTAEDLGVLGDLVEHVQVPGAVTDVDLHDPRLAGQQSPRTGRRGDAGQLGVGGLGRPVVADGDLPDPHDLVDDDDVVLDAAREGVYRDAVGAGVDEGGQPLLLQPARLREQTRKRPGRPVGAQ
jgi:hypothetical protein